MSKRIKSTCAETPLERVALRWINQHATDCESGAEGMLHDLFYGGCTSGMVGSLIYYRDTLPFYQKHLVEISAMLSEVMAECGITDPSELLRDWDKADPLAMDTSNQNLLAWFGFETAARRVADRAGIEA